MSSLTVRAAGASTFDDAARPDDETRSMQALIVRASGGDAAAQSAVLESMQHTWFRLCLSLLGDADMAADAVQETALRWLGRIGRFRGDSALQTWSLGIALNVCREIRRRRRPVGIDEVADPIAEQGGPTRRRAIVRTGIGCTLCCVNCPCDSARSWCCATLKDCRSDRLPRS